MKRHSFLLVGLVILNGMLITAIAVLYVNRGQRSNDPIAPIVAMVNGKPLFARDLLSKTMIAQEPPTLETLHVGLLQMIREEVVAQQSASISPARASIDQTLQTFAHQFDSRDSQTAALAEAGLTEAQLRQRIEQNFQIQKWLQAQSSSEPTETECRAWFEAHPEVAAEPEVVQASHFAAIFPPHGTPEEFLEKADLIRDIQSQLQSGIPFSQLIAALSDDPAKEKTGGSLSWFRRERMEPALVAAAFTQSPGAISAPVQTRFGFHLLEVSDRRPTTTLSYEQVAPEVRQRCRDELQRKKIETIVTDLLQRAKVDIRDPQMRSIL